MPLQRRLRPGLPLARAGRQQIVSFRSARFQPGSPYFVHQCWHRPGSRQVEALLSSVDDPYDSHILENRIHGVGWRPECRALGPRS